MKHTPKQYHSPSHHGAGVLNRAGKLLFIAGIVLVLCAVLCTAGCVEAPSDQIADDRAAETTDMSSQSTTPYIVLDVDPGCDDAFACFLAAKVLTEPDMYIASVGNVPRYLTAANLAVLDRYLDLKGKTALGAEKTLPGFDVEYDGFNGIDGLGNTADILAEACGFNESEYQFDYQNLDEIADELMCHDNITYLLTGSASTLAQLLIKKPELKNHIGKILMMGGGLEIVDTPYNTEYNFKGDMAALFVLLQSGIQIVVFPLDITVPNYVSKEDIAELKDTGAYPELTMILEYLGAVSGDGNYRVIDPDYAWESTPYPFPEGAVALHDAFPVIYVQNPEMFSITEKKIRIDASLMSYGRISVGESGFSVYVAEEMKDRNYINDLLLEAYTSEEVSA
ncbi:MAG: nucleoside hydrolase [Methanocorpusculum sp.]|nr:nucleoside hydrolase [Methanocorpusculum sp.]